MKKIFYISIASLLLFTSTANALDDNYKELFSKNDILFYNPDELLCPVDGNDTLVGSDNYEKIYNYFVGKGLTDYQAAGIIGNIAVESGGNHLRRQGKGIDDHHTDPKNLGDGGPAWGLVQWDPAAKVLDIAQQAKITTPITELKTQLDIIWWSISDEGGKSWGWGPSVLEHLKNTGNIEDAVLSFLTKFEKASALHISERTSRAKLALEKFKGKTTSVNGYFPINTNTSTGCSCGTSGYRSSSGGSSFDPESMKDADKIKPFTKKVAKIIADKFGVKTLYGYRADSFGEHATGLALDIMVNDDGRKSQQDMKEFGDPIFEYLKENAKQLGIQHIIWQQSFFPFDKDSGQPDKSTGYSNSGWLNQKMEDRGDITQNHYDHVHVWMNYADPAGEPTGLTDSSNYCEGEAVQGDIVKTAINFAWPNQNQPPKTPTPEYKKVHDKNTAIKGGGYTDCGSFIANVMRESGVDKEYPNVTTNQISYLEKNNTKYKEIKFRGTSDLQPGDIAINSGHTFMWVGEQDGFDGTTAEASLNDHVPWATRSIPSGDYRVFRFIGGGN